MFFEIFFCMYQKFFFFLSYFISYLFEDEKVRRAVPIFLVHLTTKLRLVVFFTSVRCFPSGAGGRRVRHVQVEFSVRGSSLDWSGRHAR